MCHVMCHYTKHNQPRELIQIRNISLSAISMSRADEGQTKGIPGKGLKMIVCIASE